LSSSSAIGNADLQKCNSTGRLAGVGAGIAVPLSIALLVVLVLLFREKRKASGFLADGGEGDLKEIGTNSDGPKWMQNSSYQAPGLQEVSDQNITQIRELEGSQITRPPFEAPRE
jgi:hypothetical protein